MTIARTGGGWYLYSGLQFDDPTPVFHLVLLRQLPLLSATVWFGLVAFQVYRDRTRTWTERFFLFACLFAGLYALSDWFFFNAGSETGAFFWARASIGSVILTEFFFLLFTLVYVGRMRHGYWAIALAAGGLLVFSWLTMPENLIAPQTPEQLFLPIFDPFGFLLLILYVSVCSVIGVVNLYRVYTIARMQSPRLARRAAGLVVTFTTVLVLGLATNGYLGITRNTGFPPPFSTLLLFVGVMAGYSLYPGSRERLSEAVRKFRARRYDIKSAFLVYEDGTLISSYAKEPGTSVDQDLFSATLDVIQNFMRTSFPILKGTSLRTIEHGDLRIIIERGRRCYLTVVLEGEENDLLRRQMRDEVLAFENANVNVLRSWRGIPEEAVGADKILRRILQPAELFGA